MSPREEELARALGSKKSVRYCNFSDLPQREFTRRDEIKRIGMIGRLSEQKNPGLFAAIVNELQDLNLEWVWIGDGDSKYREQLTNRSIAVSGWLEPNQVILEVEKLDLVLHTASWEGSPVSTLESLRMGKPVVCASIPSMVSLGYFAAGQDARTIANSLRQVILDQQSWGELISKSEKVLSQNRKGLAEEYMKKIING
jgi:glycosyltransferase involved in cell wall biosynthesis